MNEIVRYHAALCRRVTLALCYPHTSQVTLALCYHASSQITRDLSYHALCCYGRVCGRLRPADACDALVCPRVGPCSGAEAWAEWGGCADRVGPCSRRVGTAAHVADATWALCLNGRSAHASALAIGRHHGPLCRRVTVDLTCLRWAYVSPSHLPLLPYSCTLVSIT